jgi:hypothetical protein
MTFPSKEHQVALHKKIAAGGLKDLAPAELALRPAVEAYLEGGKIDMAQIALLRAYRKRRARA